MKIKSNYSDPLIILVLALNLLGCPQREIDTESVISIYYINKNASKLEDTMVKTKGILDIYPDLRLFQNLQAKNDLVEAGLHSSIGLLVAFDYEQVTRLKCFGEPIEVHAYVIKDTLMPVYYLGKRVVLINDDGSICHIFDS
jgi:hypothetical protein